jgi:hypothetical protein
MLKDLHVRSVSVGWQKLDETCLFFAGTYGCVIIPSGVPTVNKSVLQTNFSLHVFSGSILSKPLKIPFLPTVYVHTKQVNLSDARMSTYIAVSGRPDVLKQLKVSCGTFA